ncbi:MAG TPA: uroporphyrinogen-III synthase [Pyrinomonadaceae bacterium]|nr:uroporphyrinogen-III synthase [Pyrinomonadaceae bacterium]
METFTDTKSYGIFSNAANRKIINDLEESGAKVFLFPVIETEAVERAENIEFINANLSQTDWLIFPDVFSVDYFLEIMEKCEIELFKIDEKRVLTFGEAIADRLRFSQIHADIIPNSIESDESFSALQEYLQTETVEDLRFFIPVFRGFENDFVRKLKDKGAEVFESEIFTLKYPFDNKIAKLKALLSGGAVDEFVFTAPDDVFSLTQYVFPASIKAILQEVKCFATNEITMQTLHESGIVSKYFQTK